MEYNVAKLAEFYIQDLKDKEINIQTPILPTFNIDAYNDYEYLSCIQSINQAFDEFDDLHVTEDFLKGE